MNKKKLVKAPNYLIQAGIANEAVNHPSHYGGDTTYEVIKVLEDWGLLNSFCLANTVKYIARAGKKNEDLIEDLSKARWYLEKEIELLKKKEKK